MMTVRRKLLLKLITVLLVAIHLPLVVAEGSNSEALFDGHAMVMIPAGTFRMGSRLQPEEIQARYGYDFTLEAYTGWKDQLPEHEVNLTREFWIGKFEVTNAQFRLFIRATDYQTEAEIEGWGFAHTDEGFAKQEAVNWRTPGWEIAPDHPVVFISWNDANAYIQWLNSTSDNQFGLPTEAQWEYAARAGTDTEFFWGDDPDLAGDYANVLDAYFEIEDGHRYTAPVGSYTANPWGLHDMTGNVWEWCADGYEPYQSQPATDPSGDAAADRVDRGGGWDSPRYNARFANRGAASAGFRTVNLGFRLLLYPQSPGKKPGR